MAGIIGELSRHLCPPTGWPAWVTEAPYVAAAYPQAGTLRPVASGANCQSYAYEFLGLFDRHVPPHRSSELWQDPNLRHIPREDAADLDLALFSATGAAWGAHVAVVVGEELLHLCAEVGRPAIWRWGDFATRSRYARLVGLVRIESVA